MAEFDLSPFFENGSGTDGAPMDTPPPPKPEDWDIPPEAPLAYDRLPSIKPGEELEPHYIDEADQANTARFDELHNDFLNRQNEILHTGPDAYFNTQGRDALLAMPEVHRQIDALEQETLDRTTTPGQRTSLRKALNDTAIIRHFDVGSHIGYQRSAWQRDIAARRLDQFRHQAALDHDIPGSVENLARLSDRFARTHARYSALGIGTPAADAYAADQRSSILRSGIEAAVAKKNGKAAIRLYDKAKEHLTGDDAVLMQRMVDAAREEAEAERYTKQFVPPSPILSTVEDIARAQAVATERNDEDWKDADSQRATNQHYIDIKFGKAKREAVEEKAKLDAAVQEWVTEPGTDGQPQTERPPIPLWVRLSPQEQRLIDEALEQAQVQPRFEPNPGIGFGSMVPPVGIPGPISPPSGPLPAPPSPPSPVPPPSPTVPLPQFSPVPTLPFHVPAPALPPFSPPVPPIDLPSPPQDENFKGSNLSPRDREGTDDTLQADAEIGRSSQGESRIILAQQSQGDHVFVVLPDGSTIPNRHSKSGVVISPVADLSPVAEAGRKSGDLYRLRRQTDPYVALLLFMADLGLNVGQGGKYDYQREGNRITGFRQLPKFRDVSNVNVGLFCQQAGLSLDQTLRIAGWFMELFSSNYDPTAPYGVDRRTAEFIKVGHELGQSGRFDKASPD